jgi:hypothetical protein
MHVWIKGYQIEIDEADLHFIQEMKWHSAKVRGGNIYFHHTLKTGESIMLHRLLAGAKKGEQVDHANKNTLDNRRANIRIASASQNQFNIGLRSNNKSGFKGVSWCKSEKKWRAFIKYGNNHKNLGTFDDPLKAFEVYKQALLKVAGEFARW